MAGEAPIEATTPRAARTVSWIGLAIGLSVALVCAWSKLHELSWPSELDLYRDLGSTNTLLDGNWWGDHAYPGEVRWYPPLLPTTIALLCRVTGASSHVVYARGGPWLNLLGPLFFFIVAGRWLGPLAGLAATFGLLFFGSPGFEPFQHAAYSAWLWPCSVAQGMFFATLAAHPGFAEWNERVVPPSKVPFGRGALTGALLGLTFMIHPAPAVILAIAFAAYPFLAPAAPVAVVRARGRDFLIIGAVSLLFVLPYLGPIAWKYHLRTLNADPGRHFFLGLSQILRDLLSVRTLVAVLGLMVGLRAWRARRLLGWTSQQSLLVAVAAATLLTFGYGLTAQILDTWHVVLPQLVPNFHFHIYFKFLEMLAFGAGFALVMRRGTAALAHTFRVRVPAAISTLVALVALMVALLPRYLHGKDLVNYPEASLAFAADPAIHDLYQWLRGNTPPGMVVLSHDPLSVYTIAAAGRGVVALPRNFSNPYVSYTERTEARNRMYELLRHNDTMAFSGLAAHYRVGYVALDEQEINAMAPALAALRARRIGRFGNVSLEDVRRSVDDRPH